MWTVESIIDTRCRDEHGFIVPDSGDAIPCECCAKTIYIHATIVDGAQRMVVGRECAKKLVYGALPPTIAPARYSWHAVYAPSSDLIVNGDESTILSRSNDRKRIEDEARKQAAQGISRALASGHVLHTWIYDRLTRETFMIVSCNQLNETAIAY